MALGSIRPASIRAASPLRARSGLLGEEKVKGSHVLLVNEWIDTHLGEGTFKRLTGDRWGIIVPVGWYDFDLLIDVLSEAATRAKKTVEEIAIDVGRLNAERDLTSIYRFFLRIAQPQRVLSFAPRLWRTYVSFGEAKEVTNEKGHYVGQGTGFTERQIEWACGIWQGFVPTTIRLCGARAVTTPVVKRWSSERQEHSLQLEIRYS